MNFKSKICTDRLQSKKLLALGLKKETADCHWCYHSVTATWYAVTHPYDGIGDWLPAWSLHRLMEIVMKGDKLGCITHNIHQNNVATYYEFVISSIEHLIKIDKFNKDYLEEKNC